MHTIRHLLTPGTASYAVLKLAALATMFAVLRAARPRPTSDEDAPAPPPSARPRPHPRSKKKRRRRR